MEENKLKIIMINAFRYVFLSFFIFFITNCSESQSTEVIIKDPHLYVPLEGSAMTSGYLSITNTSGKAIEINGIDCLQIRAEIHETSLNAQGTMKMKKVDSFLLKPGTSSIFVPGGKHVMFWGLNNYDNEHLKCSFIVADGDAIDINFLVQERG
jgi:copper(I)-binding protein